MSECAAPKPRRASDRFSFAPQDRARGTGGHQAYVLGHPRGSSRGNSFGPAQTAESTWGALQRLPVPCMSRMPLKTSRIPRMRRRPIFEGGRNERLGHGTSGTRQFDFISEHRPSTLLLIGLAPSHAVLHVWCGNQLESTAFGETGQLSGQARRHPETWSIAYGASLLTQHRSSPKVR